MQSPTDEQRCSVRKRPNGSALMYQSWTDLLFLHWRIDPAIIQNLLPAGLFVDCFQRDAYIGVVPFFMKNIRFRGTPSVPWISNFLELNLRTYVHGESGRPGVWFLSLDCNQPLAVWVARTLFHLPYQHASMQATFQNGSLIDYRSKRLSKGKVHEESRFAYAYKSDVYYAQPGTLEFFLAERYLLFSVNRRQQISSGQVHHSPYPLREVDEPCFQTDLFELNGLPKMHPPFDHAMGSRGVDVEVFSLVKTRIGPQNSKVQRPNSSTTQ